MWCLCLTGLFSLRASAECLRGKFSHNQMKGIQTRVLALYALYSSPKNSTRCFSSSVNVSASASLPFAVEKLTRDSRVEKVPQDPGVPDEAHRVPERNLRAQTPPEEAKV